MSTLKNCISRQLRPQKLEWDKDQQQQTNVKDRAQSSRSKTPLMGRISIKTVFPKNRPIRGPPVIIIEKVIKLLV